ncbi:hypothetical protein GMJAKD_01145 [Candidatus Electrothrix aarhusensis]
MSRLKLLAPDNKLYKCENSNWTEKKECANGCVTMDTGIPDMCSAGDNAFVFPFKRDHEWQICQGYNNKNISHYATFSKYRDLSYSFDFAYGSNNVPSTWGSKRGCYGAPDGSKGKTVIAPAAGKIASSGNEMTCLNLQDAAPNGDGDYIVSVYLGHMERENSRVKDGEVSQTNSLGILRDSGGDTGGYAHIHMSAYTATNCKGTNVPFGTVFDSGYPDFTSNGTFSQWYDTNIPADGSEPTEPTTTCPNGTGYYCGKSGLGQETNYLYYCQNGNYDEREQCSNSCKTMPAGQEDKCEDVVVPPSVSCPGGNGLYCGKSSLEQKPNYLYYCQNGKYQVRDRCPDGCDVMSSGTSDRCKEVQASCPGGTGLYCGDSSLGQNTNYLYYCQNGNYQVRDRCSDGCDVMSSGTSDRCKEVQATCPDGTGLYCGKSSLNQNTSYLYYCQNGNYQVRDRCPDGCDVMSSGTSDRCKEVQASCPGGTGLYCGDSSLGQNTNYLYYCQNGNYQVRDRCSDGCDVMSSGTSDKCKTTSCPSGTGLYCGDSSLGQNTSYLYYCQNGNYQVRDRCSDGCDVMPSGTSDKCKTTSCPGGTGLYCGDSSLGQNTSYLYYCQNGNYQVRDRCSDGCDVMPSGTSDKCKTTNCPGGNGLYCGTIDSSLSNNTLYYCQNGNYQVRENCSDGCKTMPSGSSDRCN